MALRLDKKHDDNFDDDDFEDGGKENTFNPEKGSNFCFYGNKLPSSPSGALIDDIHANWFGSYGLLETHHGYIQWLFPLFEGGGMNFHSEALHKTEAALMRKDIDIALRIIKSYKLMLDFYGLILVSEQTGEVGRAKHWKARYKNLNDSHHNFLRISRIMQSLGHLGFTRYKEPFLEFMRKEIIENKQIPWAKNSLKKFWLPLLDVNSAVFIKKTLETADDREDSVFFSLSEIPLNLLQYGKPASI